MNTTDTAEQRLLREVAEYEILLSRLPSRPSDPNDIWSADLLKRAIQTRREKLRVLGEACSDAA